LNLQSQERLKLQWQERRSQ